MHLTPAMTDFILHWGDMGSRWGVSRSVAQVHALLHLSPEPLTAEEICETLELARSNVSTALKELQGWKLVTVSRELGERRDRFTSVRDLFDLVTTVIEARREREFLPTLNALQRVALEAEGDRTPAPVKARIIATLDMMQLFDRWYSDVTRLPRPVQLTALKLGAKVGKLVGKGKKSA
ncbi:GbsR/MarR family transcriptional regulator [Seohaeicola zhoushanensis]|uniref:HTH-type transcriptional regulator n=1 Tax=Seohaeicola zhoushanensis TaxID=1569283 RepID=A0A8J3M470_9RHOB|nr:MarR family transcriptional regulator [Seohaeicola zhoushanensis]GHF37519.1 transcriptional regulator [Seohaeicola zhoushanensis]